MKQFSLEALPRYSDQGQNILCIFYKSVCGLWWL